ncbi:VOC family protein [Glaciecola sp. KUL10]|jgi:predicted enzyme related to lactoylglutathione lyase|uniref:VOC family protein n=1 Tax=Glaciecola sp. (strain KUL10) TaxID=2161813 RepID=UPI000D78BBD1|nr:VOC family protein [Glaciecola sp. KUL10]GBL05773.1 glyoxalase/bleomycin resistance protein/dioxygenase [Glaciecola sp. KUL10]
MQNPVGWFEIYVQDMPRASKFYETVLGVSFEAISDPTDDSVEMNGFPSNYEAYGASGALVKMKGVPSGGSTMIYFSCEDCAVEESRVVGAGGKIERPKMSIGEYGFISLVWDTEGNMVGLHSQT